MRTHTYPLDKLCGNTDIAASRELTDSCSSGPELANQTAADHIMLGTKKKCINCSTIQGSLKKENSIERQPQLS